ncbi:MAG: hypothetical protein COW24_03005 [Candidatus Kerfeldbacteria bacterium CG15_BIG_FIL_POST_REV_8_21_14_020_45_12]|uniref:Uncharacterized protein n=1 Tax=Candidatus Kerfeldbacteria bacterium CG15_BIG_FIL_POST_REV_8_21_14_020_45_12 TaxID=2014247 RepID=A0A2M7H3U7_9BACT|nr:MAG: hypothetical protein COW24_03005 [Candidatus Kerfeldbacteria bacterium CG15_BIG_FIL_POST_REV_8_21_14_020_45_12]PJA94026.1 MAG: hypothetical protein CO132_00575 [Candidatus Kerfeldbacteria bacterium CG_4_9_14_3_um_filter_45_8]
MLVDEHTGKGELASHAGAEAPSGQVALGSLISCKCPLKGWASESVLIINAKIKIDIEIPYS